ncbi:MAG: 50S ribosomal protein L15 [Candidatus Babeliales bacterium]
MTTQLNELKKLVKKRKRIGRGGSRGGTAGRGHKGQRARSGGKSRSGFEGGQKPLHRRLPKRGFSNVRFATEYEIITLADLERLFVDGATVDKAALIDKGAVSKRTQLVKILGNGELSKKFKVHADAFTKSAMEKITKHGGKAEVSK